MNKQIIFAGLRARPVRTMVSVLAVALEVTLILVVVGLTNGISNETGRRIEGIGADIMFQPPNSSLFLALNNATMPVAIGAKIAEVEGVKAVAPVQTLVNSQGGLDVVYGIDSQSFDAVSGGFIWHKGRIFKEPNEIVVDDWFAQAKRAAVGSEVELLNQKFKISGIVENGKGARIFMSLQTAESLTGRKNQAAFFLVKVDNPDETQAVIERMEQTFPTYPARPLRQWASMMTNTEMPALDAFIDTVVFVAVCIGVLVIFLSMYTTITERTREIGILRSIGASKRFIVTLIFQESIFICLVGVLIGIGSSFIIAKLVKVVFPTLVVTITAGWVLRASVFAVLSGIIGSFYPSIKAAGQDPVEALAYE
ncbi:MAG: ABC transporter permease [Acidobacteria bacterium]|nr:ABC transporter permease [Acidobacteriota bacterium]